MLRSIRMQVSAVYGRVSIFGSSSRGSAAWINLWWGSPRLSSNFLLLPRDGPRIGIRSVKDGRSWNRRQGMRMSVMVYA